MKSFSRILLICYIVTSVFLMYCFGSIDNLFGVQRGFHIDMEVFVDALLWAPIPSLIIAAIVYGIIYIIAKLRKK